MNAPVLDPVAPLIARAALSLLFGWAAVHKLRDVGTFRTALAGYELLPPLWIVPAGAALIAAEIGVAAALWLPGVQPAAALAAAGLLLLYAVAIGINLLRGRRDIDCGCAGPAHRRPISAALVARNAVLAAAALVGAVPAGTRSLVWMDGITIAAGVLALAALYLAADGLLATAPAGGRARYGNPSETGPNVVGTRHGGPSGTGSDVVGARHAVPVQGPSRGSISSAVAHGGGA